MSASDFVHVPARLALVREVERRVPRRFFPDGAQELRAYRRIVQSPDRKFLPAVQTGLQLAVRREAEAVAAAQNWQLTGRIKPT